MVCTKISLVYGFAIQKAIKAMSIRLTKNFNVEFMMLVCLMIIYVLYFFIILVELMSQFTIGFTFNNVSICNDFFQVFPLYLNYSPRMYSYNVYNILSGMIYIYA